MDNNLDSQFSLKMSLIHVKCKENIIHLSIKKLQVKQTFKIPHMS